MTTSFSPALAAFAVEVSTVQVVHDYYGEILDDESAYGLGSKVFVGDDLRLFYAACQQRRRTFHSPEVDTAVLAHSVPYLLRAQTLADHAAQSAIDDALSRGPFEQSACLDYLRRERFEDVERFLVHAVRVDPNRAVIVERRRDEISTAFREYARVDEDGMMVLEQPMRARILKSID